MPNTTDFANIPSYVLKNGSLVIFPTVNSDDSDTHCVCVYGFSNKSVYDKFLKTTGQALVPYPLVKGYLSKQIEEVASAQTKGDRLSLVILDAADHAQPVLSATTMATVLLAIENKSKQVSIEYELVLDSDTSTYRLKK